MSGRQLILAGAGGFVLLLLAALWLLFQPPQTNAGIAGQLSASNPALDVRYDYNPAIFQPAAYDQTAEYPLRVDAADWSLYGKRIRGVASLLMREPAPVLYGFVTETSSLEYTEFFKLELAQKSSYEEVQLAGQRVLRQQMQLRRVASSLGWPAYFPHSVTGGEVASLLPPPVGAEEVFRLPDDLRPPSEEQQQSTAASEAWLYGWALFRGEDLFLFQAIAARELLATELRQAEKLIESIK